MEGLRIKQLRKEAGLTQTELGRKLGVVKQTISSWENNISEPNGDTLIQLSNILNTSPQYLLGSSNHPHVSQKDTYDKGFFFFFFDEMPEVRKKIYARMQELSLSNTDFLNNTGIDIEKEVSINDLITIAKKLKISTDYLLGISDLKEDIDFLQSITEKEYNFIKVFRKLNEDNQDIIIGDMKKFLKEQRYESVAADEYLKKTGTEDMGK